MASLTEVREELAGKRKRLADAYAEAGDDLDLDRITSIQGDRDYKRGELKRMMDEINGLGAEFDHLALLDEQRKRNDVESKRMTEPVGGMQFPGGQGGGTAASRKLKPIRELIAESKSYRELVAGRVREASIEVPVLDFKTLITLTTVSPQNDRRDLVNMALEDRTVGDLMLQGETDRPVIEYYEETTFNPLLAATVAEGAAKAEGEIAWTLRTDNVRKIAWWIPATDEALSDNAFLESEIRGRLAFGVRRREEQQLLAGSGVAPQILGLLNRTGLQTIARGAEPAPDTVYRAMQLIRGSAGAGFADPTGAVFHPNDWTDLKLLKTADGQYLYGSPADEAPDRIWGLTVRQTTAMTENTVLVGAFRPYAQIMRRTGITIMMSTEHASYAIENKVALIAEERLALQVTRPSAFCTATAM